MSRLIMAGNTLSRPQRQHRPVGRRDDTLLGSTMRLLDVVCGGLLGTVFCLAPAGCQECDDASTREIVLADFDRALLGMDEPPRVVWKRIEHMRSVVIDGSGQPVEGIAAFNLNEESGVLSPDAGYGTCEQEVLELDVTLLVGPADAAPLDADKAWLVARGDFYISANHAGENMAVWDAELTTSYTSTFGVAMNLSEGLVSLAAPYGEEDTSVRGIYYAGDGSGEVVRFEEH